MKAVIDSLKSGIPAALTELKTLGEIHNRRAVEELACFDRPTTSNAPAQAINGRLDHLSGLTLGLDNLTK